MLQAALKENIIVYLPTGSGKTFIAAMLINELSGDVCKPLVDGGKRLLSSVNFIKTNFKIIILGGKERLKKIMCW